MTHGSRSSDDRPPTTTTIGAVPKKMINAEKRRNSSAAMTKTNKETDKDEKGEGVTMIIIYRPSYGGHVYDCGINVFHGRDYVSRDDVVIKTKTFTDRDYVYAEPTRPGRYAFGGTLLFTSDGSFSDFNTPIKLHDRDMNLEVV
jgi:hypothetical protein